MAEGIWPDGSSGTITVYCGPDMYLRHTESVSVPVLPADTCNELAKEIAGEIERCRELARIWAEEGIDAEFPASPEDRARFFDGQAVRLQAALHSFRASTEGVGSGG